MRTSSQYLVSAVLLLWTVGCVSFSNSMAELDVNWMRKTKPSPKARAYAHYLTGIMLEREGQFKEAFEQMKLVPELDEHAITPILRMIRTQLRDQQYEAALSLAEEAVRKAPKEASLWIVLGEIHHQLGQYEAAVDAFNKAITLKPDDPMGYGALVELQENVNDLVAAVDIYQRLIELSPQSAALYYQLGLVLIRINDVNGAQKALNEALRLNPQLTRARYYLGTLYLSNGQLPEAVAQLEYYLRSRPQDIDAAESLGGALMRLGQVERALGVFTGILVGEGVQPQHHLDAMYVLLRADRPATAENVAPPQDLPALGALYTAFARQQQGKDFGQQLAHLDASAKLHTELDETLGSFLFIFGEKEAGEWLLERIEALQETGASSRALQAVRGRVLAYLDRYEEATEIFESMLEQKEEHELHYYLAAAYQELKDFEKTERHLKAYLHAEPDDAEVLNFLGYLYAEHGVKLDEGKQLLEQALEIDPENPYYLDSLGWVYYQQRDADKAIEYIQRAIYRMDTDDAVLRDHLGDAYLLKGDVERAVSEWRRALRLDPDLKGVKEKLEKHNP